MQKPEISKEIFPAFLWRQKFFGGAEPHIYNSNVEAGGGYG